MLELLGYAPEQIRGTYGNGSLFETTGDAPTFTSGDIFNLFSSKVRLHPIDLTQPYLEHGWASAATMLRPTLDPAAPGSRRPPGTSDDPI